MKLPKRLNFIFNKGENVVKIRNIKQLIIFILLFIIPFTAAAAGSFYKISQTDNIISLNENYAENENIVIQDEKIEIDPPTIVIVPEEEVYAAVEPKPVISEEYPTAAYIWNTLKSWGWNDYVCAGIMGNLMRETGGDTLYIKPTLYDASGRYYGICQWSAKYCPKVQGTNLDTQLNYLKNTVEKEFNTFGKKYSSGFTYWHFTQMTDEREAAVAFAACYERCSTGGNRYLKRQNNATTAYKYFVG